MANLLIFGKLLTLCLGSAEIAAVLGKFPGGCAAFARSEVSHQLLCLCCQSCLETPQMLFGNLCIDQRVPASQISDADSINTHLNVLKIIQKWSQKFASEW